MGVSVILRFVMVVLWDVSPLTRLCGFIMICVSVSVYVCDCVCFSLSKDSPAAGVRYTTL